MSLSRTSEDPATRMTSTAALRERWRCRLRGVIAGNQAVSEIAARGLLARARLQRDAASKLRDLAVACRRTTQRGTREQLHRELSPYLSGSASELWRSERIGWSHAVGDFAESDRPELTTSLILKAPGPGGEKGVLYSSFEYNWMKLVANHDLRAILEDFYVVGATSWSPADYAVFGNLAGLSEDPVFMGISNVADIEAYRVMRPAIEPVPLMACDWTNPNLYSPKTREQRTIDILMVANWLPFKRHWLLFEALRKMPRNLRIVLVGRNAPGRTEREILAEARAFGVRQKLELVTNVDIDEVTRLQCDARISIVCSRREGSCVAPAESLFADTPIALMEDAHVGVKAHVNAATGMLLSRSRMAEQLMGMLEHGGDFSPRAWAIENISCHKSSALLNDQLRTHALRSGRPWTVDIAPLCWRYVPTYVRPEDRERLAPAVRFIRDRFGVELVSYSTET